MADKKMSPAILWFFFTNAGGLPPEPPEPPVPGYQVFTFDVQMNLGAGWISVVDDVRTVEPPVIMYGISGTEPDDRIADAGTFTFAMNNGSWNSTGTAGYYSPRHSAVRAGFGKGTPVRVRLTYNTLDYWKFYGKIWNVAVTPGVHEDRLARCTAHDMMNDYALTQAPAVEAQFNQTGAQLVETLLAALPTSLQPPLRDIDLGLDVFPIALDTLHEESHTVREALNDVPLSDLSKIYFVGTTVEPGGMLVYRNRHYASFHKDVLLHLEGDIARGGLVVPSSEQSAGSIQVFVHPTRVDDEATTILYDLQTTQTLVAPGATYDGLFGPYRDPLNPGDRVGGTEMIQPEATTDYLLNSASDGTGVDMTAFGVIVASYTGSGVRFSITNTGEVDAYVTKLQCRGKGIYRFTAVIERSISDSPGDRVVQLDMPYQSNTNVGDDVSRFLEQMINRPPATVTFLANRSIELMDAALQGEPGARVALTEEMTGLDDEQFTINNVRYEIQNAARGPALWCTWLLDPAGTDDYWVLGVEGASEIGMTTTLGF